MTLDELIARAGGVGQLARIAGVDHSTISSSWRKRGRVPVERALIIHEKLSVPLHEIRPDVWLPRAAAD